MRFFERIILVISLQLATIFAFGTSMASDTIKDEQQTAKPAKGALFQPIVIFYQPGDYYPGENDQALIMNTFAEIKGKPTVSFVISGYTDPTGSAGFNQHLSEQRTKQIKKILIANGIAESKIIENAYGESRSENLSPEDYPKMRKVEIMPVIMMN